jgi:hypothetical protein
MNTNQPSTFQTILKWLVPILGIIVIGVWMYISPEGALGKLDAIGYAVCHRIDGIALLFQAFVSGRKSVLPSRGILAVLILFFLAFGIDGVNSYVYLLKQTSGGLEQIPNLYLPNNTLRLFTGSGMGIALASVLFPVINQTLWKEADNRPALEWKNFGILVAIIIVVNFLILTDSPLVLFPIAYISALGTLSLLVLVFMILWMIMMRQDNTFDNLRQLWLPFASGLTLALLLILGIDLLRLTMTGTWNGFPGLG